MQIPVIHYCTHNICKIGKGGVTLHSTLILSDDLFGTKKSTSEARN